MGIYLNSRSAFGMFRRDCCSVYFVDKTDILKELVPLVTLNNEWEENALHPRKGQQLPDHADLERLLWPT